MRNGRFGLLYYAHIEGVESDWEHSVSLRLDTLLNENV